MQSVIDFINGDKVKHFMYGLAMAGLMVPFGSVWTFVFVAVVAVIKEYIDDKRGSKAEPLDVLATLAGPVFLFAWYAIVDWITLALGVI